jgi:hypothetical protein
MNQNVQPDFKVDPSVDLSKEVRTDLWNDLPVHLLSQQLTALSNKISIFLSTPSLLSSPSGGTIYRSLLTASDDLKELIQLRINAPKLKHPKKHG